MSKQPESKVSTRIMKKWREMGAFCYLENGCWEWTGPTRPNGYGAYKGGGVHRFVYELFQGPILEGNVVDHLCHDPRLSQLGVDCPHRRCINPAHLRQCTMKENNSSERRANANLAKTHCKWGHPFDLENTRFRVFKRTGTIGRICNACVYDRIDERKARGKAA